MDLRQQAPTLANGQPYPWNPEARTWRLLVAPPGACDAQCVTLSQGLGKVWQLFGHNADNVEILWLGTPPASIASLPALRRWLRRQPCARRCPASMIRLDCRST